MTQLSKMRMDAMDAARSALMIAINCTDRLCQQREIAPALREAEIAVTLERALNEAIAAHRQINATLLAEDADCAND